MLTETSTNYYKNDSVKPLRFYRYYMIVIEIENKKYNVKITRLWSNLKTLKNFKVLNFLEFFKIFDNIFLDSHIKKGLQKSYKKNSKKSLKNQTIYSIAFVCFT